MMLGHSLVTAQHTAGALSIIINWVKVLREGEGIVQIKRDFVGLQGLSQGCWGRRGSSREYPNLSHKKPFKILWWGDLIAKSFKGKNTSNLKFIERWGSNQNSFTKIIQR